MNIGNAIKGLRKQKGFKQNVFAEMCGLSQSYLSLIEKGKKEPTLNLLKRISSTLSMPLPILIFLSIDMDDVADSKKDAFKLLEPTIKGLINDVFITETT